MLNKISKPIDGFKYATLAIIFVVPPFFFHDSFSIPKIIFFTVAIISITKMKSNEHRTSKSIILIWLFPLATLIVSINDNYNLFINFFGDYKRGFGIYLTVLSIYFITKISNQPKIDATKVIKYLLLSVISICIYQFFQIIDLDFMKISNAQTYSSLIGNINMAGSLVAVFSLSLLSANQIFKKREINMGIRLQ